MAGDNDGLGATSETSEPPLRVIAGLTGLRSLRSARLSAKGRVRGRLPQLMARLLAGLPPPLRTTVAKASGSPGTLPLASARWPWQNID